MARSFNGSNEIVSAGSGLPSGAAARTLSVWAKPASSAPGTLLSYGNTGGGQHFILQDFATGGVAYMFTDGVNAGNNLVNDDSGDHAAAGAWGHYCLTFDGTTYAYYFNGSLRLSGTFAVAINTGTPNRFAIGNRTDGNGQAWSGDIAEVAVFNAALTAGEAAAVAKGVSAFLVRPAAVAAYLRLTGRDSPEPDYRVANAATVFGATRSAHPDTAYPHRRPTPFTPAAARSWFDTTRPQQNRRTELVPF